MVFLHPRAKKSIGILEFPFAFHQKSAEASGNLEEILVLMIHYILNAVDIDIKDKHPKTNASYVGR